jgi:hypothetical protein
MAVILSATVWIGLGRRQSGVGLDHRVVGAMLGVRALGPESRQRDVDEVVAAGREVGPTETGPIHRTGAEVLDDDIGLRGQREHDVTTLGTEQVDGDRALATIAHLEQRRDAADGHSDPARDVTQAWSLDLDDLRTLIGEHGRRVRTGERDR